MDNSQQKTSLNLGGKKKDKKEKEAYLIVSGNKTWQFSFGDFNGGGISSSNLHKILTCC